jgi:hypothetical protein
MKRFATLLTLAGLTLVACQDNAPTGPGAASAPLAARGDDRGGGNDGSIAVGYTSTRGIKPIAVEGNTTGSGAAECAKYGGGIAVKIEGATNARVAGYSFTVGGGGTTLAFAYQSGGNVIGAVLVKGGPGYSVYQYGTAVPTDGNLSSPVNLGGNVPTISHYTVCYKQAPPPKIDKKFVAAYTGSVHNMVPVQFVTMPGTPCDASKPYGGCLPIDQYATLWIKYEVTYTSPFPGTVSDDLATSCSKLNSFNVDGSVFQPAFKLAGFQCTTAGFYTAADPNGKGSTIQVGPAVDGKLYIMIDIINNGHCGDRPYVNKVTLNAGGLTASDEETVWLWPRGIAANGCDENEGKV